MKKDDLNLGARGLIQTPRNTVAARLKEIEAENLESKKTPESAITFPEINALSLRDVNAALSMAYNIGRENLIESARPDFDARVAALEDRHRRLTHTAFKSKAEVAL